MPPDARDGRGVLAGVHLLILAWAGIAGAAGVALAAVAAHKVNSPALATAATMLMLHAASAVGIVAVGMHVARPRFWQAAGVLMLFAASLFSGEIAFYTLTCNSVFQVMAPIGGTLMIASWLLVAGIAVRDWLARR